MADGGAPLAWPEDPARLVAMAQRHYALIARSLRRLGIAEQGVDDAAQQVFVLAAEKIAVIEPGRERAFLFQTALRIAMAVRRNCARRREAMLAEEMDDFVDPRPLPDALAEAARRRRALDELLDALPMDLRTVFVLYEIEELDSPEIASLLDIPVGTVASRLRRARGAFRRASERLKRRLEGKARR